MRPTLILLALLVSAMAAAETCGGGIYMCGNGLTCSRPVTNCNGELSTCICGAAWGGTRAAALGRARSSALGAVTTRARSRAASLGLAPAAAARARVGRVTAGSGVGS